MDTMKTRGATQCSSPRWGQGDFEAHVMDSVRSGEMDLDIVGVSVVEWFGITDAEATPEDIEELNAMDEDEDILDEWNDYYTSTRL